MNEIQTNDTKSKNSIHSTNLINPNSTQKSHCSHLNKLNENFQSHQQNEKPLKIQQILSNNHHQISNQNKTKQKLYKQILIEEQNQKYIQRVPADQRPPTFRQNYQIHQFQQQISQYKQTIQLKNKQIFYLSNQIVSLKDQYAQKISQLQTTINQNKKQLTEFRYTGLKTKREQSQKSTKLLQDHKKNYQLQIKTIKDTNDQLLKKINQQHNKNIQNIQDKFITILKLQKKQKNAQEQFITSKINNYQEVINSIQVSNNQLKKSSEMQYEENNKHLLSINQLKNQLKLVNKQSADKQNKSNIEINKLNTEILSLQTMMITLKKQIKNKTNQYQMEIKQLSITIELQKQQIIKIKNLLYTKDKQISKLMDDINRDSIDKIKKTEQRSFDPIRNCNHQGLLMQLERNLSIKNKQNQQLREQLKQWGKYIGFERTSTSRTLDLLNASSQALITQQNFVSTLKKKFIKI